MKTVDRQLAAATHTSQAGTSQHLRALREANLVAAERNGAFVRYRIAGDTLADFYRTLRVLAVSRLPELDRITGEYFSKTAYLTGKRSGCRLLSGADSSFDPGPMRLRRLNGLCWHFPVGNVT